MIRIPLALPALLAWAGLLLSACTSPGDRAPDGATAGSLKLYAHTADKRMTYFELDPSGELRYAGGRSAILRKPEPVMTLTPEQRQAVWAIVEQHDLMEQQDPPRQEPQQVTYELHLTRGWQFQRLRAVDDQAPGIEALHDLLFDLQADQRYVVP